MFDYVKKKNNKIKKKDTTKSEKNGSEIKQLPWGEVPEDLLLEIKSRLLYSDQVRFFTVCKNWFAVNRYNTKPLPWIINISYTSVSSIIFQLLEPSPSLNIIKPTFVYQLNLNQYDIHPYSLSSISTTIHKYGLIFCCADDKLSHRTHFLLFSPFTKKAIKFPPKTRGRASLSTFYMDPNSRDYVFLLLCGNVSASKRISIRTFSNKDKSWTSSNFDRPKNFESCGKFPVYIKGIFYFVFPVGKLASYNVDCYEWKVENVIGYDIFLEKTIDYKIYEAFELNEELMLVCIKSDKSGFIARLDWSMKAWVPLESLGNHSLFCSKESIFVSPIGNEEINKGVLPNKVYYRGSKYFNVYSLESGKLAKFMDRSGITSWDKVANRYSDIHWLEPPHLVKQKLWDFWAENNSKKSVLPIVHKQCPNGTDSNIVKQLGNLKMDQTGKRFIDEMKYDELESMRILDKMRRSRNAAKDNNTSSIKVYNTDRKSNLRKNIYKL